MSYLYTVFKPGKLKLLNCASPNISFKLTVLPKNVILYVCAKLFFSSTPSKAILPSLKGKSFNSNLASTLILASKPPLISKL